MDARQFPQWGKYLSQIGWIIENISGRQIFIRPIPVIGGSIIKIQRPKNPLPFEEIDQIAKKHHALVIIIEPDLENYQPEEFKKHGFKEDYKMSLSETATIKINLDTSSQKLFASFSENARRNIKKAKNNNIEIKKIYLKDCQDNLEFKKFYQLLENLSKQKKFFIPDYGEFYKKMLAFKNNSILFFAYLPQTKENLNLTQPIGVIWVGYEKDTAVYMHVGMEEKGYQLLANYLLVWEAMLEAQKKGLKIWDFEGAYDPRFPNLRKKWVSFTEFKKRFHGEIIEYPPPYVKCYNILFKGIYLCNKIFSK